MDKFEDLIHEGFDPIMCMEDIIAKYAKQTIRSVMSAPRERTFAELHAPLRSIMENFAGESVEDLEDGFINGQEDMWKWVESNIQAYNVACAPPNMAMMANMKSQQQFNMLKNQYVKYQAAKNLG